MTRERGRNSRICNRYSMACIFNAVLLDLSAGITDSFEGRLIRGGGGYSRGLIRGEVLIGGLFTSVLRVYRSL